MEKYPAPALGRGLEILHILNSEGDKKLEELTKLTDTPKASINRYLKTLVQAGYVRRDPDTKRFHCICAIEKSFKGIDSFKVRLPEIMKQLVDDTGFTAEWYEYKNGHAVITARLEPENVAVKVLASEGFYRLLDHEFEAVSKIFISIFDLVTPTSSYFHRKWDEIIKIPVDDVKAELELVRENSYLTSDKNFNHNGVRRCATAIFDSHGRFLGVLALAGHYHPSSNKVMSKGISLLQELVERLKEII